MNKKNIIIASVFGAAIIAALVRETNKCKTDKFDELDELNGERKYESKIDNRVSETSDVTLEDQKNNVMDSMQERHNFAANVIRRTFDESFTENTANSGSNFEFDKMDADLDELLNEED